MARGSSAATALELVLAAGVVCALLLAPSSAAPPGDYEDDRVHDFLRVLDRAAAYRGECFGECAKGCYCADNPYSCLRECMPTPSTRRCGATYGVVQGVFSSSATFSSGSLPETGTGTRTEGGAAGSGDGFFSTAT